jgi:hypothetical protein
MTEKLSITSDASIKNLIENYIDIDNKTPGKTNSIKTPRNDNQSIQNFKYENKIGSLKYDDFKVKR